MRRWLARAIYGAEPCLLIAQCVRESSTRRLHSITALASTPGGHGYTTQYHEASINPRLLTPSRGTLRHTAKIHVSPHPPHWTRFMNLSALPPCQQHSTTMYILHRKASRICQHASGLCQQQRTYAKKGCGLQMISYYIKGIVS